MKQILNNLARSLGGAKVLRVITRSSDLVLAIFLVMIILMIILPVPPTVIDVFIGINLSAAFTVFMVSLYISKAVELSIFPSILLITTLFRLGIEISATRQILLHANAGEVIEAFGMFVVGGSYVVGGVIFLIITIVQFIVITKGAERVAEVAARFTLDAMPGKQMSIDADMRSGIIDANQARDLRLALTKESQLYGAMDGAMKFVKGDVIAGIVIAVINIVGGLIIGIFMHGMQAAEAAKTYTLLSIGGGLVSQIPSLIISITAGMVTTRVSTDEKDSNIGRDLTGQILNKPKGVLLGASIVLLLGLIPAFPTILFLTIAAILYALGINSWFKQKQELALIAPSEDGSAVIETGTDGGMVIRGGKDQYTLTLPVILEVGSYLSTLIQRDREGQKFIEINIPKMRHSLYQDLGVRFPGVHVRTDAPKLEPEDYVIYLNEVPLVKGKIVKNHLLTNETKENLQKYNVPCTSTKNIMGQESFWVERKYKEILDKAGMQSWDILDVIILHLSYFFRQHASEFIGIQEVRAIVEFMEKSFPDLVKEVTRLIPLQKLTDIFRRLIQEQISIKDLRTILEALSEWAQTEKDTILLTEYVRSSLKRFISYKYSRGQSILSVYLLDPEIEDIIRGGIKQTSGGSYIHLDPETNQMIIQSFRAVIKPTPPEGHAPVIMCAIDVRRFVRKLIEGEFPDVSVISSQEVVNEIRIQPLGRIQFT
jgi:type III secretion protein V